MTLDQNSIVCKNVSKRYGYFFALKNISLTIGRNQIFGLVGENGAGKTTLIKILSGLLRQSAGEVIITGLNFKDNPIQIKKQIGILTDECFLYNELTIFENLKFYAKLHSTYESDKINAKIEKYTKLFNINDWIHEPIHNLSKGMKKKVELIRALFHSPKILLLDEPFSSLDQKTIPFILGYLKNLNKEKSLSIIISTHNIDAAKQICDEIAIIKKGKIIKTILKNEFPKEEIEKYI